MQVFLNGTIQPAAEARVSVFDRGFLFGDGIYEGLRAFDGWVRDLDAHCARMQHGLDEAGIPWDASALGTLSAELLEANGLHNAFLYWQITRGTPPPGEPVRARLPAPGTQPTVFGFCHALPSLDELTEPTVCTARTVIDDRWHRGHVKAISLIANIIAGLEASHGGAGEALLLRDGWLSESCSTNVFVALPETDGSTTLLTPPVGDVSILSGVTREILLRIAPRARVGMVSAEDLARASEVFLVGTMTTVKSVVSIDGRPVGDGTPGPIARETLSLYQAYLASQVRQVASTR